MSNFDDDRDELESAEDMAMRRAVEAQSGPTFANTGTRVPTAAFGAGRCDPCKEGRHRACRGPCACEHVVE
jgi:hypothetical protein